MRGALSAISLLRELRIEARYAQRSSWPLTTGEVSIKRRYPYDASNAFAGQSLTRARPLLDARASIVPSNTHISYNPCCDTPLMTVFTGAYVTCRYGAGSLHPLQSNSVRCCRSRNEDKRKPAHSGRFFYGRDCA